MITSRACHRSSDLADRQLVFYARNPRKNDAAVDRMCGSIREFGFKIPVLARSDGEVVDGHLRLKAARKLGITRDPGDPLRRVDRGAGKAFRLMVNRSVTWADWDEELLALELQELNAADFDLEPDRLRSQGDRRPAGAPGRGEGERRAAAARESGVAARRSVALRQAPRAVRRLRPAPRPWRGCWATASRG